MTCAWKELLSILPGWMTSDVDRIGKDRMQELRLRLGQAPQLILREGEIYLQRKVTVDDLNFCVNSASRYSPWAAATAASGYLTAPGGHRLGLCGEAVVKKGKLEGIKNLTSICLRVARDFPGIGEGIPRSGSILLLGAPGWGKTTLLRDLIRSRSNSGCQISVVDERGELFPVSAFSPGSCTDILTGASKADGIQILLRTMGPQCIAVDEITWEEDCLALSQAAGCGVDLIATAHAASLEDLKIRPVYRRLLQMGIFQTAVILHPDKSWKLERIML